MVEQQVTDGEDTTQGEGEAQILEPGYGDDHALAEAQIPEPGGGDDHALAPRKSGRERRPPSKLKEYVLGCVYQGAPPAGGLSGLPGGGGDS